MRGARADRQLVRRRLPARQGQEPARWLDRRRRDHPRAQKRTNEQAAILAKQIAAQLKAAPDRIDELVKQHGEDPGAKSGEPYQISADAPFVPEFKNLGLRLEPKEVGIVKTRFGYHDKVRVPPAPPEPQGIDEEGFDA